jgi:hypothetical protein
METEKACDHNDHYDYSDDVENIHCFGFALGSGSTSATRRVDRASASLLALRAASPNFLRREPCLG